MSTDTQDLIVTVTPTIGDGAVVRWHRSHESASYGNEFMSASRNGVMVECYLHEVPEQALADARAAFDLLRRGRRDDVQQFATHVRRGLGGPVVPVEHAVTA